MTGKELSKTFYDRVENVLMGEIKSMISDLKAGSEKVSLSVNLLRREDCEWVVIAQCSDYCSVVRTVQEYDDTMDYLYLNNEGEKFLAGILSRQVEESGDDD